MVTEDKYIYNARLIYIYIVISICQWNINGLTCDKLVEIQPYLQQLNADIIILSETWLSPNISFTVDLIGYKSLNFCRPCKHKKARRNSGGLLIYIKDYLSQMAKCIKVSTDRVWIKLQQTTTIIKNDIYICATYIPPHASSSYYLNDPPWPDLQRELSHFNKLGAVILIGDLNARIGGFQSNLTGHLKRTYKDQIVNSYGAELMSLCTGFDLSICNGTFPPDNVAGECTCHTASGSSCIDYAIVNGYLTSAIKSFHVNNLEVFSDHCPILLTLSTGESKPQYTNQSPHYLANELSKDLLKRLDIATSNHLIRNPPKLKWIGENITKFIDTLKRCPPELPINPSSISDIDETVTFFTEKIIQHAIASGFAKVPTSTEALSSKKSLYPKQSWFDNECKQKKKEVLSKLSSWRKKPINQDLRKAYHNTKAAWKRLIKSKKFMASRKWNAEILKKAKSNPKSFWNTINTSAVSKAVDNNISCSEWEQYFSKLYSATSDSSPQVDSSPSQHSDSSSTPIISDPRTNSPMNQEPDISTDEIELAISKLKCGKAPGTDLLTNEVLKSLPPSWLDLLQVIFNAILRSGEYPSTWAESIIKPIYKSGNRNDPSNYRGISLISCLGKLFTAIIRDRMSTWAENSNLLPEEQFGFQKGKRTADAIFALHTVAEKQCSLKKKLYCCFVDFRKAFDSVCQPLLWSKLEALNLNPQILSLLKSYYSKSRSRVAGSHGHMSNFFTTEKGVKQGCNLSPLLFSLYISDLPRLLNSLEVNLPFFPSPCLLFADDVVLFTDNPKKLQDLINSLCFYCRQQHLDINSNKTKILVFGQKPKLIADSWEVNSQRLEIVTKYKYLGTWLCWKCDFKDCLSKTYDRAHKPFCQLQAKIASLGITDFNVLLFLFKALIKPILMYNAEIWGLYDAHVLDKIQYKYLKYVLRVSHSCVNSAVLAETGSVPLLFDCESATLRYFYRLTSPNTPFLTRKALEISIGLSSSGYNSWMSRVKRKLLHLGFNIDFILPTPDEVLSRLHDQVSQKLRADINSTQGSTPSGGNKLRTYRLIKSNTLEPESYLSVISNPTVRQAFTKLRISDHKLSIETGRHCKPPKPLEDRTCPLCNSQSLEDEIHFLIHCSAYRQLRSTLFEVAMTSKW